MKIVFCSVGKPHEAYIRQGVEDFTARVSRYFPVEWHIIPPPKNAGILQEANLKQEEGKLVLQFIQPDDQLVLLDERGLQFSSPQLADFIQQKANKSIKRLVFLIAGAFGADKAVVQRANDTWSLSKLVFPHMLVRLILAEQVYRACSILRNEKYHHT